MESLHPRPIREEEMLLVNFLLIKAKDKPDGITEPNTVYTMNDGGMGSIRFVVNEDIHIYQRDLIQADYTDEDDVPVFISLNLNTDDKLFELDIFKGDFSPLKKYPTPQDLHSIR